MFGSSLRAARSAPKRPQDLPEQLHAELDRLEDSAKDYSTAYKWEEFWFWICKIPAMIAGVSTACAAYLDALVFSVVLGVSSAVLVFLDGFTEPGRKKGNYLNALCRIRDLEHDLVRRWNGRGATQKLPENTAKDIIKEIETKEQEISKHISHTIEPPLAKATPSYLRKWNVERPRFGGDP